MPRTTPAEALSLVKTSSELEALGLSPATSRRHFSTGKLHRIRRGAYVDAIYWQNATHYDRSLLLHAAVVKQTNKAVLTRQSAALWYGAPLLTIPARVHLDTPGNGYTTKDLVYHGGRAATCSNPVLYDGARLASALQVSVDAATQLPPLDALCIIDYFAHGGLCSASDIRDRLRAVEGRGSRRAAHLADLVSDQIESPAESIAHYYINQWKLPAPLLQHTLYTATGAHYRPDFVWVEQRVILEVDGEIKYSGEFGEASEVIRAELRRQRELEAQGWTVIRVRWRELMGNPWQLKARLQAALSV